jgi:hypothetical protein
MFRNCKWVVGIETLELGSYSGKEERIQFYSSSNKNAPRHKRFERLN